jgi:hypothetical protein
MPTASTAITIETRSELHTHEPLLHTGRQMRAAISARSAIRELRGAESFDRATAFAERHRTDSVLALSLA